MSQRSENRNLRFRLFPKPPTFSLPSHRNAPLNQILLVEHHGRFYTFLNFRCLFFEAMTIQMILVILKRLMRNHVTKS